MKTLKMMKTGPIQQDLFNNLPQAIMIDIFLRLPLESIMRCKCVCKSWQDLIKTPEFVESHFSRSVPCLAVSHIPMTSDTKQGCHVIKLLDTENSAGENDYHFNVGLNLICPNETVLHSSANGLLLLSKRKNGNAFICNPITREYIELPRLREVCIKGCSNDFGFGASKLSGEYKVVRLFYEYEGTGPRKCVVYPLVEGLWRSVVSDQLQYAERMSGSVFANGNLHWLVALRSDLSRTRHFQRILCFDLETEYFSTFSIPHLDLHHRSMCALGDSLCLYDISPNGLAIWLMKKYGDAKSWTKEFVIEKPFPYHGHLSAVPIKVFKDGDILFTNQITCIMYCYSTKTKTVREIEASGFLKVGSRMFVYTPSFVPLKTFTMENDVISY